MTSSSGQLNILILNGVCQVDFHKNYIHMISKAVWTVPYCFKVGSSLHHRAMYNGAQGALLSRPTSLQLSNIILLHGKLPVVCIYGCRPFPMVLYPPAVFEAAWT